MESEAKYALVGAAVLILTALTLLFVLWLSEVGGADSSKNFTVYFHNHTLDGLQRDSDVTMKGIKVGTVQDFKISDKDIEQVNATLRISAGTPIKTDTRAVIRRNLLTGLARIDLIGSSQESPLLSVTKTNEKYPIIPEGQTDLEAIANSIPRFVEQVGETLQQASGFFSDDNRKSVTNTLKNLESFTKVLGESDKELKRTIKNLDKVTSNLDRMTEPLTKFAKKADKGFDELYPELKESLRALREGSLAIEAGVKDISKSFTGAADVVALEITSLAQDISQAAQTFSATVEKFEDPQAALLGPSKKSLGPGEESRLLKLKGER